MSIIFIILIINIDMNHIKLIDINYNSFYTSIELNLDWFILNFIKKEIEAMLQSYQNVDRLLESLGYGRFIPKPNRLSPRRYAPLVDFPADFSTNNGIQNLPLRVSTEEGQLVLEAAMPGVDSKDIDIFVENDSLKISGKFPEKGKTEENTLSEGKYLRPSYQATVDFPSNVDLNLAAPIYENGLLTITIPKKLSEQGRRIDVQVKDHKKNK